MDIKRSLEVCEGCMHLKIATRVEFVSVLDQKENDMLIMCRLRYNGLVFVGMTMAWAREQPWWNAAAEDFERNTVPQSCGRVAYETLRKLKEL